MTTDCAAMDGKACIGQGEGKGMIEVCEEYPFAGLSASHVFQE